MSCEEMRVVEFGFLGEFAGSEIYCARIAHCIYVYCYYFL